MEVGEREGRGGREEEEEEVGVICGTAAFRNRHTRRGVSFSAQSFAQAQPILEERGTHCSVPRRVHVVVISAPI